MRLLPPFFVSTNTTLETRFSLHFSLVKTYTYHGGSQLPYFAGIRPDSPISRYRRSPNNNGVREDISRP